MRLRSTLAAAFTFSLATPALANVAPSPGWNIQSLAVALEFASWGLMILGFGAAGGVLRLQRRRAAT